MNFRDVRYVSGWLLLVMAAGFGLWLLTRHVLAFVFPLAVVAGFWMVGG